MNKTLLITFMGAFGAFTAGANMIGPGGGPIAPDAFGAQTGLILLASTTQNINPVPGSSFNATYTEYVYRDTGGGALNGLCTGCLDFIIVLSNAGPGVADHISSSIALGFAGFSTDGGYATSIDGGPTSTGITPSSIDRSSDGAVVDFDFLSPNLTAGLTTAYLEIQTNAMNFTTGTVAVQDGVSGFNNGFSPASATPEPGSIVLLGLGLIGIGMLRRKLTQQDSPLCF